MTLLYARLKPVRTIGKACLKREKTDLINPPLVAVHL